jgi:cytochrome c2
MLIATAGCMSESTFVPRVHEGDPERGRTVIAQYECGVCHEIPGVPGAVGRVGPPLESYARHPYIAGKFPNLPETLVRWIPNAPALAPRTAMPAIEMTEQDARDIAAFLYESQ